jgi:hypothetical protein
MCFGNSKIYNDSHWGEHWCFGTVGGRGDKWIAIKEDLGNIASFFVRHCRLFRRNNYLQFFGYSNIVWRFAK